MDKNRQKQVDAILDVCMERVSRGESIDSCLAAYPEQAGELRPLLEAFVAARRAAACVAPEAEFKARARYEFNAAVMAAGAKKRRPAAIWRQRWAVALTGALVFLIAGGGTVAASTGSMPDQPLYTVKLAAEQVRLTLTPTSMGKALYAAQLADERVNEIVYAANKNDVRGVEQATRDMTAKLETVARNAGSGTPTGAAPEESPVAGVLSTPSPALASTPPDNYPPVTATTAVSPLVTAPSSSRGNERNYVTQPSTDTSGKSNSSNNDNNSKNDHNSIGNNDNQGSNEDNQLSEKLARNAASHTVTLQDELNKAPDNLKPALSRALQAAKSGYNRALQAAKNHGNSGNK